MSNCSSINLILQTRSRVIKSAGNDTVGANQTLQEHGLVYTASTEFVTGGGVS